ncbi:MAG: hypothetical protein HYV77_00145, partial [Candidatus Wildermuthbacteria bacterium]|nr:hypothetical protein [Candidatus Wildermuthbacteria bacterium]
KYRGPSPIQFTVLNGETEIGVTIMLMDEEVDHGPIIAQRKFPISNFQFPNGMGKPAVPELRVKLAQIGGDMLVDVIPKWVHGELQAVPQDHSQAIFTRIITKDDGRIDWNNSAEYIDRQVRAFTPWPGTFTFFKERQSSLPEPQRLLILLARETLAVNIFQKEPPGTILRLSDGNMGVVTGKGILQISTLQIEGKKPMSSKDFFLGHQSFVGLVLS